MDLSSCDKWPIPRNFSVVTDGIPYRSDVRACPLSTYNSLFVWLSCTHRYEVESEFVTKSKFNQSFSLSIESLAGARDYILLITSNHCWFIHHSSLAVLYQQSSNSEAEETWQINGRWMHKKYFFHCGVVPWRESLRHRLTDLISLRWKACREFLSLLKKHRIRPGLNSRILGQGQAR